MWRTLCVAIHEFYRYLIKTGGRTMFAESCQGMEHALQAAKAYNRNKSNGHQQSVSNTTTFLDLHCVGSVKNNQVNFATILKRLENEKKLIYDICNTPKIENSLFDSMPDLAQVFINKLKNSKFGDAKDIHIEKIISKTQTASFNVKKNKIIAALKENDDSLRLQSDSLIQQSDAYLNAKIQMDKRNEKAQAKSSTKNEMHNFRDALSHV